MLNGRIKYLGLLLCVMILSACVAETAVSVTVPSTRTPVTQPQPTITLTSFPSPIPIQTVTPSSIETETKQPTHTPQVTATSQSTATSTPYFLPEWVTDPNSNILHVVGHWSDDANILFHADSGEQYEVDNELVNVSYGTQDNQSPNSRYDVQIIGDMDNSIIVKLVDQETDVKTELHNPFRRAGDEKFGEYAHIFWSPDGVFFAAEFVRWDEYDKDYHDLAIYTSTGELFRQYENLRLSWKSPWSPNQPYRILVTDGNRYFQSPCVLEIVKDEKDCLKSLNEWSEQQDVALFNSIWSPDGSKISFIHWNSENNGLCYFTLDSKEIFCPIRLNESQSGMPYYPRFHHWSPDGQYLVLFFDKYGPSDVAGRLGIIVVEEDGQNPQLLGYNFDWPDSDPWNSIISLQKED